MGHALTLTEVCEFLIPDNDAQPSARQFITDGATLFEAYNVFARDFERVVDLEDL